MNSSSLRKMAVHSSKTISKLVKLWGIKSSKLGEGGYFCAIEDCSVRQSGESINFHRFLISLSAADGIG
jgi:hypothetical protein